MKKIPSPPKRALDIDGSQGITVEPGWTSKWLRMTTKERAAVLTLAAREPLLVRHQVASVLQGTPPELGRPFAATTFLDEAAPAMARMDSDVLAGRFALPCTPAELLSWSSGSGCELPAAFTQELESRQRSLAPTISPAPPVAAAHAPSRSGKASTTKRDQKIFARGHEEVKAMVSRGESIKKDIVIDILAPEFGMSCERVYRVLSKAGIDWSQAKAMAQQVRLGLA